MRSRVDVDGRNPKPLSFPPLSFRQVRFQFLQFQVAFSDIVGALGSDLLHGSLHALHLFLHVPDRRLGTGHIGLQCAFLRFSESQRSTLVRRLCPKFSLQ